VIICYAQVSTVDQNPDLQIDALKAPGWKKIYIDKASGSVHDRPELDTKKQKRIRELYDKKEITVKEICQWQGQ